MYKKICNYLYIQKKENKKNKKHKNKNKAET